MIIILFLFAAVGITSIIVDSKMTAPIREAVAGWPKLHYLLHCYQCSGVWVGLLTGILYVLAYPCGSVWPYLILPLVFAGATSYLAQIGMAIYNWLIK